MYRLTSAQEYKYLSGLFFLFGFGIMAWVPRFPEIKTHLHLTNGEFGSLISTGSIGGVISLLTMGHVVHKFGTKKVLTLSAAIFFLAIGTIVHTASSILFLICNLIIGAGISAFHIAIHAQAFHTQERSGKQIISQMQGLFSLGAVTTAILSGILSDRIGLALHIDILSAVIFVVMMMLLARLGPALLTANIVSDDGYSFKTLFTSFHIDWLVSGGLVCAIFLEFATTDWATIFTHDSFHLTAGVSTIPYILFMFAMIIGRLSIDRLILHTPIEKLVKRGGIIGGSTFIIVVTVASQLEDRYKWFGFALVSAGFFIAGLASSFLGPTFFNIANHRSSAPSSVVVGQLGVVNNVLVFGLKWVVAWTAQLTSLSIALMIPAAMLVAVSLFSSAMKNTQ